MKSSHKTEIYILRTEIQESEKKFEMNLSEIFKEIK